MSPDSPAGASKRAQPESFRARALSAALTVKDLQKSVAWYRDVVGFFVDESYVEEGKLVGVALKAGGVTLMLNQDDGAKGWDRTKGEGISLHFMTGQNVDDIAKRVKERGGTLDLEPTDMPWGARLFRMRDPDGFRMSVSSGEA